MQTCCIMSRVRLPGVDISDDETDDKLMRWEKRWRSSWWVSMRFHKFISALPSCWSCKNDNNSLWKRFSLTPQINVFLYNFCCFLLVKQMSLLTFTFSCLFCFSASSDSTVISSFPKITSPIFLDRPDNSFKLGWTFVMIMEESIPSVAERFCMVLIYFSTRWSLSLF